jgi:hypothetical protein
VVVVVMWGGASGYGVGTCPALRVLEDISLWVDLTRPTRHDAARFTSSPNSFICSRVICPPPPTARVSAGSEGGEGGREWTG